MRNPLLTFFAGYNINRYFIKLKLPRDFTMIQQLRGRSLIQAGTSPWRGLHANWFLTGEPLSLLDFSQLKQYKLGFDSSLAKHKSIKKLKEYRHIRFGITYAKLTKEQIFYNFFFNHGTYNSTSNHSILL